MRSFLKQSETTKGQKRAQFASFPGLVCLLLITVLFILLGFESVKVFSMIFVETAKQYSLPQDVIDDLRKIFILHVSLIVMFGVITGMLIEWIILILKQLSVRGRAARSGSKDGEERE